MTVQASLPLYVSVQSLFQGKDIQIVVDNAASPSEELLGKALNKYIPEDEVTLDDAHSPCPDQESGLSLRWTESISDMPTMTSHHTLVPPTRFLSPGAPLQRKKIAPHKTSDSPRKTAQHKLVPPTRFLSPGAPLQRKLIVPLKMLIDRALQTVKNEDDGLNSFT